MSNPVPVHFRPSLYPSLSPITRTSTRPTRKLGRVRQPFPVATTPVNLSPESRASDELGWPILVAGFRGQLSSQGKSAVTGTRLATPMANNLPVLDLPTETPITTFRAYKNLG